MNYEKCNNIFYIQVPLTVLAAKMDLLVIPAMKKELALWRKQFLESQAMIIQYLLKFQKHPSSVMVK